MRHSFFNHRRGRFGGSGAAKAMTVLVSSSSVLGGVAGSTLTNADQFGPKESQTKSANHLVNNSLDKMKLKNDNNEEKDFDFDELAKNPDYVRAQEEALRQFQRENNKERGIRIENENQVEEANDVSNSDSYLNSLKEQKFCAEIDFIVYIIVIVKRY